MELIEILGREDKTKKLGTTGTCFLGNIVGYPGGKYSEVGRLYLDIVSPHCVLVLGKRGTGKSYTLGVLAESFGLLPEEYRNRIAVVVVDTMSVFSSLKRANVNREEVQRARDFWSERPRDFDDYVRIYMPKLSVDRFTEDGESIAYDGLLQLPLWDVDVYDWLSLFELKATEPAGYLLVKVIEELKRRRMPYGYEDIYGEIEKQAGNKDQGEALKGLFSLVEDMGLFAKEGAFYGDIVKGGQLSVLDISYLGRLGGFDVRNLIVALIARRLMRERTLYTTLEMQSEAGLIEKKIGRDIASEHPLVYMMLDEAHLFLPSTGVTLATEPLIDWIKLGRHPGLSLALATQEPSALHESAIRQADLITAHNITSSDDIEALGKAKQSFMKGREDIQSIVSTMEFKRGLAVVFDDKTRKIEMVRVRPRLTLHTGVDASAVTRESLRS